MERKGADNKALPQVYTQMCYMSTEAELYTDKEGTWELVQQAVKCFQKLKTQWHGMLQWRGDQNLLRAVWTVASHGNREQPTTTHMNRGPRHLICVEMIKSLALEVRTLLQALPFLSSSTRTDCKYGCQRTFLKAWPVQGNNEREKENVHLCISKVKARTGDCH